LYGLYIFTFVKGFCKDGYHPIAPGAKIISIDILRKDLLNYFSHTSHRISIKQQPRFTVQYLSRSSRRDTAQRRCFILLPFGVAGRGLTVFSLQSGVEAGLRYFNLAFTKRRVLRLLKVLNGGLS
jgi:hypothetical protein